MSKPHDWALDAMWAKRACVGMAAAATVNYQLRCDKRCVVILMHDGPRPQRQSEKHVQQQRVAQLLVWLKSCLEHAHRSEELSTHENGWASIEQVREHEHGIRACEFDDVDLAATQQRREQLHNHGSQACGPRRGMRRLRQAWSRGLLGASDHWRRLAPGNTLCELPSLRRVVLRYGHF